MQTGRPRIHKAILLLHLAGLLPATRSAVAQRALAARLPPKTPTCGDYTVDHKPTHTIGSAQFTDPAGPMFMVYSLKDYIKFDLKEGDEWIGLVHLIDDKGLTPKVFSTMDEGDLGCLQFSWYRLTQNGPLYAGGFLKLDGVTGFLPLHRVAICHHNDGIADSLPPHVEPDAGDCKDGDTVRISIASPDAPAVTTEYVVGEKRDGSEMLTALKNQAIYRAAVGDGALKDLANAFAQPGPWFPCSAVDCCRVF